jgi:hypothetical protein
MVRIERRAFRSEDNGPVACSGPQAESVKQAPEKGACTEPSTKHVTEAVHLCVFAPADSPLDRESVNPFFVSPLTKEEI